MVGTQLSPAQAQAWSIVEQLDNVKELPVLELSLYCKHSFESLFPPLKCAEILGLGETSLQTDSWVSGGLE
jgi:hypothetical protein